MNNEDVNPSESNIILAPSIPTHFAGMSTPSGYRFFDNSTLDTFRTCMRKGYFRHVRNWEPAGVRVPLVFGSAMHAALDSLWADVCWNKIDDTHIILENAMKAFYKVWIRHNMDEREELDLFPRSPGRASQILDCYLSRYHTELEKMELIAIETPFVVPLNLENELLFYIGKWDKVARILMKKITIFDHKTTSSMQTTWQNQFNPDGQVDGYQHGGIMTYGDDFDMIIIDGLLVQKTNVDVQRLPQKQMHAQLDAWGWETSELIDQIFYNEERLLEARATGNKTNFLPAFPKCPNICTHYYGLCSYLDLCKYWSNPEHCECPEGFIENPWEPFKISEKLDGTFDIELTDESD